MSGGGRVLAAGRDASTKVVSRRWGNRKGMHRAGALAIGATGQVHDIVKLACFRKLRLARSEIQQHHHAGASRRSPPGSQCPGRCGRGTSRCLESVRFCAPPGAVFCAIPRRDILTPGGSFCGLYTYASVPFFMMFSGSSSAPSASLTHLCRKLLPAKRSTRCHSAIRASTVRQPPSASFRSTLKALFLAHRNRQRKRA